MLFVLLLAVSSIFTNHFRRPVDRDPSFPYEVTPYGPQSWEEAIRASKALQGEDGDIRYNVEPSYAGINRTNMRWPGPRGRAIIPYSFNPEVKDNNILVDIIKRALKHIEDKTCIRFKERTVEKSYVLVTSKDGGCSSYVGKQPLAYQPQHLSLGPGCEFFGTAVHEFCHAIGLFHEHQRSDRDKFINVYPYNVAPGHMQNFNKTEKVEEVIVKRDYNYYSIMQYGECAFSKDKKKCYEDKSLRTMEAKNKNIRLKEPYEKSGLNEDDIALIKKLYNCK